jgi:hypothetical protein
MGIINPKPSKSIKMVTKRTKIGERFFILQRSKILRTLPAIVCYNYAWHQFL